MKAYQLVDSLLSEVEDVKATSQCETNQLLRSLEKVHTDWIEDWQKQQKAIDLFSN